MPLPFCSLQVLLPVQSPLHRRVQLLHCNTSHQSVNRQSSPDAWSLAAQRRDCSSRSPPAAAARTCTHPASCALDTEMRQRSKPLITTLPSSFSSSSFLPSFFRQGSERETCPMAFCAESCGEAVGVQAVRRQGLGRGAAGAGAPQLPTLASPMGCGYLLLTEPPPGEMQTPKQT